MPKRLKFTQNFLKPNVVEKVFNKYVKLGKMATVLDIGAGEGSITKWLLDHHLGRILAFEVDKDLNAVLEQEYNAPRLKLYGDYLSFKVGQPYEVVSNIPFMSTATIIDKLTKDKYFQHGYLVMQTEAGERFAGMQITDISTLQSIKLENSFIIKKLHSFSKSNYKPAPSVTTALFEFTRREETMFSGKEETRFIDFVEYLFAHSHPIIRRSPILGRHLARKIKFEYIPLLAKSPTELSFDDYKTLFTYCNKEMSYKLWDSMEEERENKEPIKKIYRTRLDQDWKKK